MTARIRNCLQAGVASLIMVCALPADAGKLDAELKLFLDWFPGEYDNYAQSWQDRLQEVEQPHEHIHHIFAPVSSPAVGAHVFFVQQYMDGDRDNIYRQRLYSVTKDKAAGALRLTIYSFKDESAYRDAHLNPAVLEELQVSDLIERPGCEVFWRLQQDDGVEYFHGTMIDKACSFVSERSGERIYVTDDLRLTPDAIWIRDEAFDADGKRIFGNRAGIHHKNRKVTYFTGWAGFRTEGPGGAGEAGDADWFFKGDILIHNQGQKISIPDHSGTPSGYSIQLEDISCQGDATTTCMSSTAAVLKLGLIDDATGKTLVYSWSNPDAERVGINVRWAQAGLTRKSARSEFGYDPEERAK